MALNLFPSTPTLAWSIVTAPNWATRYQRAISGRQISVQDYVLPLYTITLTYEVLRDFWDNRMSGGTALDQLRTIWNFYNGQQGATVPFMWFNQSDNMTRAVSATPQIFNFAVGDGITQTFQMASPLLAPVIPHVINSVDLNGSPTVAYTIDFNTGLITFTSAPGNGILIGADYTFYYVVRFAEDSLSAENFAWQFWTMKQLKLLSVTA